MASTAVPSTTRLNKLVFSDFAAAWTIFGNIPAAVGTTSHNNARDSVPAATYGAISSSLKYAFANIVSEVNMNWHAPKPNTSGSTWRNKFFPSNRSTASDHKSRVRQMATAADNPTPIHAPAIIPAEPKLNASTRNTAPAKRPAPPRMVDQPNQKKS